MNTQFLSFFIGFICGLISMPISIAFIIYFSRLFGLDGPRDYSNPDSSEIQSGL